jgi:D-alanine-D-alanine ligase
MKIGITYDLREDYLREGFSEEETAEFDRPETIDAIEQALLSFGYETVRIGHIKNLVARLATGERWDLVFNIAEGLRGYAREAQVPALLDAYEVPYTFSDPLVLSLALHKGMTKHVMRSIGIPTPDFAVVESIQDIDHIHLPFPLFAKPVAEGTGKGIKSDSKITSQTDLISACQRLLMEFMQPVLVERYLPGREFTVGIVGTGKNASAIAVMEVMVKDSTDHPIYSYDNKENYEERVEYRLVNGSIADKAKEVALAAWRGLGCRDGGRIDLRADEKGIPNFVEVNPLAGLHPVHSDLPIMCGLSGITYCELIQKMVRSALVRLDPDLTRSTDVLSGNKGQCNRVYQVKGLPAQ